MRIFKLWNIGIVMVFTFLIVSCEKGDENTDQASVDNFSNGVFIVNEGLFNTGTGTISFLNRGGSNLRNKIYQQANNSIPIGNIVQSMNIIYENAFILVNNSDKVEVVKSSNFSRSKTIENIPYPAYIIHADSNKAYISSWDNKLVIISLESLEAIGEISAGTGPTKMIKIGNKIWVLNQGGFGLDSTVSIIDISIDQRIHNIQVYPRPTGIQKDENGNVWVMCSGKGDWHGGDTKGHLVCIDPENYSIIVDLEFPTLAQHPEKLIINSGGDIMYYSYPNGIYKFDISSLVLETEAFIPYTGTFYGLAYDNNESIIYSSDPLDYAQNGLVYLFDGNTGEMISSFNAGVIPGEFCFLD